MTEHDERNETPEDAEIEAHGLKETAAAGMSAAAMLAAGAGTAAAATPASQAAGAKPSYQIVKSARQDAKPDYTIKLGKSDPTQKGNFGRNDPTVKLHKKGESARVTAVDKTHPLNPAE